MSRKKKPLPVLENVTITDYAAEGKSLARVNDLVVFVPFAVPGDVVDLQVRRKKHSYCEAEIIRFVKPSDVPTYIERGVADIGVVGKDTLLEENKDVYEIADLGFGACRMCVAGYRQQKGAITNSVLRVASKYENVAREYYARQGITVDIIKLNGSVELGPVIGLSDVIVDIVESGRTLEANDLSVLEEILLWLATLKGEGNDETFE